MLLACSGCLAMLEDGPVGCQALYDRLRLRLFADRVNSRLQRLMEDTYYLQHPDRFCVSGKSVAAHLTGLCCACEHDGDTAVINALEHWPYDTASIEKPELPPFRGVLTIADMQGIADADAHDYGLELWARSTWDAHSALHPLAREWVRQAVTHFPPR